MKYVCEKCGRSFDTAIGCQEHEAHCEIDRVYLVKFKFWFTLDPARVNDNFSRRIERSGVRIPREEADPWTLGRLDQDFSGGMVSFTTICRPEDEEVELGKFMYNVEQAITNIMYAVRNARLAFIGSVDYIKEAGNEKNGTD